MGLHVHQGVRVIVRSSEFVDMTNELPAVRVRFREQGIRASADQVRNELQRELGQEASKARTFRDVFEYIDFYVNARREGNTRNGAGPGLTPGSIGGYLAPKSARRR